MGTTLHDFRGCFSVTWKKMQAGLSERLYMGTWVRKLFLGRRVRVYRLSYEKIGGRSVSGYVLTIVTMYVQAARLSPIIGWLRMLSFETQLLD